MNMSGVRQQQTPQGLTPPISITPPTPEATPPPPLTSPDECLAYLMGKVGALENECTRLSGALAWTQQELERAGNQVEIDMEALRAKHQDELALLKKMLGGGGGGVGHDERKGNDPQPFKGDQRELESWITCCRMSFANQPSKFGTEGKKVLWAASFLEGLPLRAFQPIINRHLAGEEPPAELATFEGFVAALRDLYGDPNLEQNSRTVLRFLEQQTSSVSTYYAKFVSHSQYANLDDGSLADSFYRGLNGTIKDKLAEGGPWKGLYQLKTRAIQLDSRIRERKTEKEFEAKAASMIANARRPENPSRYGFNPQPRNPTAPNPHRTQVPVPYRTQAPMAQPQRPPPIPPKPTVSAATRPTDGTTPMELDAQTRAALSREECRALALCYYCKKKGHRFYDCSLRPQNYSAVEVELIDLAENDDARE
jgi:hypothetical protein